MLVLSSDFVSSTALVDAALKAADEAVYEAKHGGRNQVRVAEGPRRLPKSA